MIAKHPDEFRDAVQSSLIRHAKAIGKMVSNGMYFWDYGNAFLLESSRAGADILNDDGTFIYPSYVEDIMGPMCFDYGFGPFRWVCCSNLSSDLEKTDSIAGTVLSELARAATGNVKQQYQDNIRWIESAGENQMVVGSKARILYADERGRRAIASAFNSAIRDSTLQGPIVLGRDHHDVGGTDSPYRETANIRDGSQFTADMSLQNFIGDGFRGATWVSLHNGGGVGWGEVVNGGFGLVLDGSEDCERRLQSMLSWDVNNGVARRAWARNSGAEIAAKGAMLRDENLLITMPFHADNDLIDKVLHS
jgi:urocanate hydratase